MSCPFLNPEIINHLTKKKLIDTLHVKSYGHGPCDTLKCGGSLRSLQPRTRQAAGETRAADELLSHAREFIDDFFTDSCRTNSPEHRARIKALEESVRTTGSYELDEEELIFGARQAWRNNTKCIGRRDWKSLEVFDGRRILTPQDMFDALCHHIAHATNKGKIRPVITIFPQSHRGRQDCRLYNDRLISYAGYKASGGREWGDPANLEITEFAIRLGWQPKWGNFDVLPLIISVFGEVKVFDIPKDLVLEVPLKHPTLPCFEELGLRWFVLNSMSNQLLDCGGLFFPACPFSCWFMGTQIGSQALCGSQRYNLTEVLAINMGLDTKETMWKEHVLIETNMAVLYSFEAGGVSIINHHDASDTFISHLEEEYRIRGGCPADWASIVPPMSQSTLQVFHQEMLMYFLLPGFFHQEDKPWKNQWKDGQSSPKPKRRFTLRSVSLALTFATLLMKNTLSRKITCTILYSSETGKSEILAQRLCDLFRTAFLTQVHCLKDYKCESLVEEKLVLIITSTFGNGEPPENGKGFAKDLLTFKEKFLQEHGFAGKALSLETSIRVSYEPVPMVSGASEATNPLDGITGPLKNTRFAVFGLGSKAYPFFAVFGKYLYTTFKILGAESLVDYQTGDALHGQEESFRSWSKEVFKASCNAFCLGESAAEQYERNEKSWSPEQVRLVPVENGKEPDFCDALIKIHGKKIIPFILMDRTQLQAKDSNRQTILVKLNTDPVTDIMYCPGDHVAIFPSNCPEIVTEILDRLDRDDGLSSDQVVRTEVCTEQGIEKTWTSPKKLPICSLQTSFSCLLDINSPPTQSLLLLFANQTSSETEKERLKLLATNTEIYEKWCTEERPNLLEVLDQFPSLKIPATLLLTQLPLLQPRLYSLSSSPQMYPKEIHVTIGVVKYQTKDGAGPVHEGVCSSWLNQIPTGTVVPGFIRNTQSFQMPIESELPIIMIGAGSGISPFRSFWQQRLIEIENTMLSPSASKKHFGEMILFYGCRTTKEMIYAEELEKMKELKVLSNYHIAFSREQNLPKMYVQNEVIQNAAVIFEMIEKGGHCYISGSISMAEDVIRALEVVFCQGGMTKEGAAGCVTALMDKEQIHQDIFGRFAAC